MQPDSAYQETLLTAVTSALVMEYFTASWLRAHRRVEDAMVQEDPSNEVESVEAAQD